MTARRKIQEAPKGSIIIILIVSALLNMLALSRSAFIFNYYASAAYSMTRSFSNLLYAAYDPAGYLSVHQTPLGLMLQSIFVKVFGFHLWSLCMPQIIAGVLSCFVLYRILKRNMPGVTGGWAALFGALCLAVTPVFVAIARSNMPDMVMILLLLLSAHAMLNAATGRKIWLMLLSALLLGLAFNVKINQCLIAGPAILLVCFLVPRARGKLKTVWAGVFAAVFAAAGFGWMLFVDTKPDEFRPYVGGTNTNSAFEMSLSRLNGGVLGMDLPDDGLYDSYRQQFLSGQPGLNPLGIPGAVNGLLPRNSDAPGPGRLFSNRWYSQGSWMLLFAAISTVAAWIYTFRYGDDLFGRAVVLFSVWLVTGFLILSFTQKDLSSYYMAMLAPPVAACSAMGVYAMAEFYREHRFLWILLPLALLFAAVEQASAIISNSWAVWTAAFPALCLLLSAALLAVRLIRHRDSRFQRRCATCTLLACLLLLAAPFSWSLTPVLYGCAELPQAGPQLKIAVEDGIPEGLVDYLDQNFAGSAIMLVAPSAVEYGSVLINQTGWNIIAAGGYDGRDRYISLEDLQRMAGEKRVRYMLVTGNEPYQEYMEWVLTRRLVPYELWYRGQKAQDSLPRLYDLWVPGAAADEEIVE